jgi:hypothetical protein
VLVFLKGCSVVHDRNLGSTLEETLLRWHGQQQEANSRGKSLPLPLALQPPSSTLYWKILTRSQMAKEKFYPQNPASES